MGAGDRRGYGIFGFIVAAAVSIALIVPANAAAAVEADDVGASGTISQAALVDPSRITGLSSDAAAASCWEIKQLHPDSPSGAYWLLTPAMSAPTQVWCDQETDGGGWVKVGQGRQGWETNAVGRGSAATLLDPQPAPASITTQLSAKVVDQLLNGKRLTELSDGIRVRRAASIDGSSWQEVRFAPNKPVGWFWSMGAGWPLSSWRIGTSAGSGGSSTNFGSDNSSIRVDTSIGTNHTYTWGFSYGNGVAGSSAASSYLWTPTDGQGGARPFSQVYLRPKLMTSDFAYSRIPDTGTAAQSLEVTPDSDALPNPWGVTGLAGSVSREGDVEVQDMVAIGNTMFVGGNFRYAQQNESGSGRVEQPFLAAFNASTGQFISSFRPVLDEAVLAVAGTPDGKLAIGGKFTSVNGAGRAGFAVIDPSTGQLSGPQPALTNSSSPGMVRVETIAVGGGDIYIGGTFTHTAGPTGAVRYTRNASRIDSATRMPYADWRPEMNGTVLDIDVADDASKAYFAGFMTRMGAEDALSVAAVSTSSPATLDTAWKPTWSSTGKFYQRAIERHGDRIYVGGSEHSMFAYDAATYQRVTSHITNPKGDFQTLLAAGGFLYGGSHSNAYIYEGATFWPNVGTAWSRADTIGWSNAWRLDAGSSSVSTFSPTISARLGSGAWATAAAPDGTIWSGGDFQRARVQGGGSAWTGAFVRFPMTDGAAPSTPTSLRATDVGADTVRLAWNASSGGIGTGGSYQIIRDDRVIASTTTTNIVVPLAGERRYFVRAADATGNVSASSPAITIPGGNPAPTAVISHTVSGLDVTFDATGSRDDGTIVSYFWKLGDGAESNEPITTHRYLGGGSYEITLTTVDDKGSSATSKFQLELEQPRPADTYGASVFDDQPWAYWRLDEAAGSIAAADSATGTRVATYQSGVTQGTEGVLSGSTAADFDGVDDVLVANDAVSGPNQFSAEVWFNTTTTRGGKLIGFGNAPSGTSSSYDRHIYMQDNGRLVFGVYSSGEFKITTDGAFNDGEWHHAVGTLSPTGMTFYVDGKLVGTNAQSVGQDYVGYWRVGGDSTWGSSSRYFDGKLDEAAIYGTALNAGQIWEHYSTGLSVPNQAPVAAFTHSSSELTLSVDGRTSSDIDGSITSGSWDFGDGSAAVAGMTATHEYAETGTYQVSFTVVDDEGATDTISRSVAIVTRPSEAYAGAVYDDQPWAYWRFEEQAGTVAADSSRGGHSATYRDGVLLGAPGIHPATHAADFDGSNDLVSADERIQGPQVFSTEAWFKTTTTRGGKLIGFGSSATGLSGNYDRHVYMQDDGRLVFGVYDGGTYTVTSNSSYNDGEWHQVVSSLSSSGLALYVDGQLVGTNAHTVAENFAGYWRVGGDATWGSTSTHLDGLIDEVSIYDIALSAAQVADHYAIGSAIPNQPPVVEFSYTADYHDVMFDASASTDDGEVSQVSWDFGDGSPSVVGAIVTHNYAAAGSYTVVATATDDEGASASLSRTVVVADPPNQAPVAAFTHEATALDVDFTSTSSDADGNIVAWVWEFGDGASASGATTSHSFATAGEYAVSLTVTDDVGASSTATQMVAVAEAPNQAPIPQFEFAATDLSVEFDGTSSTDPDGSITSVEWDFGDGSPVVSGDATELESSHTYGAAGTYTVTLTVTDDDNAASTTTRAVVVTAAPANSAPTSTFAYTATFLDVTFDGSASSDVDGSTVGWRWDFGDGSPVLDGAEAQPAHTYAVAGTYTVTLTVTDDDGASGSSQLAFAVSAEPVNAPPVAQFTSSVENLKVMVDGSGSADPEGGNITTWAWDFGDGSPVVSGSSATAEHVYAVGGDYDVTLVVTDEAGATGSMLRTITVAAPVNLPPAAAFTLDVADLKVDVDAASSVDEDGTIAAWAWDFGDGMSATGKTATHTYGGAGTYEVTLTVTDNDGAEATTSKQVTVDPGTTGEPVTREILTRGSTWAYWYSGTAPAGTWNQASFDASGWSTGAGPIGYGSTQIVTNLNPTSVTNDRPRAVYFRSTFDVSDASKAISLNLTAIGDDGVVVYVNGVEVGRKNMRDGTVTNSTFATSARRVTVAENDLLTVAVPTDLLVSGINVIAAETHVNFRATPDVTFWATGSLTEAGGAAVPNQAPTASFDQVASGLDVAFTSTSSDADGTIASTTWDFGDGSATTSGETVSHTYASSGTYDVTMTVTDDDGATASATEQVTVAAPTGVPMTSRVVSRDGTWSYWYSTTAPASDWSEVAFNPSGWSTGAGPLGYGSNRITTDLNPPSATADRPRAAYFRSTFEVADASQTVSLSLSVIGDDGVVVYVNGVEVGRKNMRDGAVDHLTFAQSARRVTVAENDLLTLEVPRSLLVSGTNVITAETHVNYRGTPDVTFWATADLTELR